MATNAWGNMTALAGLLALTVPAAAQPADTDPLTKIGHIVVIFEENRSFDNFFGEFPGATGIANASDKAIQIDPDGKAYRFLTTINTNLKPPDVDKRFPSQLPNSPFQINRFV
jgi:phospholipase C